MAAYFHFKKKDYQFFLSDKFKERPYQLYSYISFGSGIGIFWDVYDKVKKEEEITPLLLKTFLEYFAVNRDKGIDSVKQEELLANLIEKYEDDIFDLISFKKI